MPFRSATTEQGDNHESARIEDLREATPSFAIPIFCRIKKETPHRRERGETSGAAARKRVERVSSVAGGRDADLYLEVFSIRYG